MAICTALVHCLFCATFKATSCLKLRSTHRCRLERDSRRLTDLEAQLRFSETISCSFPHAMQSLPRLGTAICASQASTHAMSTYLGETDGMGIRLGVHEAGRPEVRSCFDMSPAQVWMLLQEWLGAGPDLNPGDKSKVPT